MRASVRRAALAVVILAGSAVAADARCSRWPDNLSSAFDPAANAITIPWRTDYPTTLVNQPHAWESVPFRPSQGVPNWQDYMAAVLSEIKASGVKIANKAITMNQTAPWF